MLRLVSAGKQEISSEGGGPAGPTSHFIGGSTEAQRLHPNTLNPISAVPGRRPSNCHITFRGKLLQDKKGRGHRIEVSREAAKKRKKRKMRVFTAARIEEGPNGKGPSQGMKGVRRP